MSHMQPEATDSSAISASPANQPPPCVETGTFTPIPIDPPKTTMLLDYATVAEGMNKKISETGIMTFHMTGCAGDPNSLTQGLAVGEGMASQIASPPTGAAASAFFYHLGDITYKHGDADDDSDTPPAAHVGSGGVAVAPVAATATQTPDMTTLWNTQFYTQYSSYHYPALSGLPPVPVPIFAVAGNHDAKTKSNPSKDEIGHFLTNFCGTRGTVSPDNLTGNGRTEMYQPYPYWVLETPLAYIIGLYTNDTNGGILDDPHENHDPTTGPQFTWLVEQLKTIKAQNGSGNGHKAVLLTLHYPPFSGAANFAQRGDPTLGPTKGASHAVPVGMLLQQAFQRSGQLPDAVFSAHAHLYQRLTYTYNKTTTPTQEVPYLIVGTGGHAPTESLLKPCDGKPDASPKLPLDLYSGDAFGMPPGLTIPATDTIVLEEYFDASNADSAAELPYGFLTVTITVPSASAHRQLQCAFYTMAYVDQQITATPVLRDSFTLDLKTHLLVSAS